MSFKNHYTGVPEYQKLVFRINDNTGRFERVVCPIGFNKVPIELKIEDAQREDYKNIGAKYLIRSRQVNNKRLFQTGLIYTGFKRLYFGDHFHSKESVKNSFCLFHFNEPNTVLTIYYFNHIKVYPNKRESFVMAFIQREKLLP